MVDYAGEWTLRQARRSYFDRAAIGEGGYEERWVRLQAGPLVLRFPNTKARVRSVKLHDLHHVLTGYDTSWTGEAEIGAWEIASGCADHHAAWGLNLNAVAIGLAIAPRAVYGAFLRGRKTANLYHREFEEALLERTVGEMRRDLGLDQPLRATTWADRAAFLAWATASVAATLAPLALLAALVAAITS